MSFGKPMYFDGDSTDLQHLRVVTDQIMNAIHAMSDQEYIDIYAPKKPSSVLSRKRISPKRFVQLSSYMFGTQDQRREVRPLEH